MILAAMLAATPLAAEEAGGDIGRGAEMLSDGARLLFQGLLNEVEPRMRDMAEALEAWEWDGLSLDDLSQYEAPEVLPNGDIIIRRKTPLVPQGAGPEVEL